MDIVKLSTDWAKAPVFSAKITWLFSTITIITVVLVSGFGAEFAGRRASYLAIVSS